MRIFKNNTKAFKVTLHGFIVNIILTFFKFFAGIFGRSSAMLADAIHSLSDLVSDIIVLIFVDIASKPDDEKHRYGHGKFETFSSFVVGMILFFAGLWIMFEAATKIFVFINGEQLEIPENLALWAAVFSILLKEIMFWYTLNAGKKLNSKLLIANAWHHRSDALSSVATLIGIAGAIFLGGKWGVLDPLAAFVVSFFICKVAYQIVWPAINELLEQSLPKETRQEICKIVSEVDHVHKPHNLKSRSIGNNIAIEIHVYMDQNMSVQESHEVTVVIENKLRERFGEQTHISIHVEPLV